MREEYPSGEGKGVTQIITEKHQGHLDCISSPGAGAKFIIEIPIQQIQSVQAKIPEAHNIRVR